MLKPQSTRWMAVAVAVAGLAVEKSKTWHASALIRSPTRPPALHLLLWSLFWLHSLCWRMSLLLPKLRAFIQNLSYIYHFDICYDTDHVTWEKSSFFVRTPNSKKSEFKFIEEKKEQIKSIVYCSKTLHFWKMFPDFSFTTFTVQWHHQHHNLQPKPNISLMKKDSHLPLTL